MTNPVLKPGDTIGILGGGQLGRMLALAAAELGLNCHIYAPEADSCAFDVVRAKTCAPYEDESALARFAEAVAVITYEFENVPAATANFSPPASRSCPGRTCSPSCRTVCRKKNLSQASASPPPASPKWIRSTN
jgi:5-(carboxyamino)imidazole ribonucleotide synthase